MKFYDRKEEVKILRENEVLSRKHAMFTVLVGRRRIGKTTLVLQALKGKSCAYLFVSKDSESMLCQKFQQSIEEQLCIHIYGQVGCFRDLFEIIMKESQRRHFTIVLDEFQNLYKINPAIFSEIQDIWDRMHATSKLNLIVSGSIQSMMKHIFEDESEPLYGRPTSKFTLKPFTISVLKQILKDHNPKYKNEDLLCLYMITGGVAKYVELLMDSKCYTKEKMLNHVCRQDSYFLTEGRDLLNNEFSNEFGTYFSILQLIAQGLNHRSEIDGTLQRDTGTYLQNLEKNFEMIRRIKPILSKSNGKVTSYELSDNFLRFWFRFIYPYQSLIERNLFDVLRKNISEGYEQFSGHTLERYFQEKMMESGLYSNIGNWWDRKGTNEIDIVALNEAKHSGIIAEVKRNPNKISLKQLQEKAAALPSSSFGHYKFQYKGLSLEDM